jgi:hypothetical protein
MHMLGAMGGIDVMRRLRRDFAAAPVISPPAVPMLWRASSD